MSHAFAVLECLASATTPLGPTELARLTGLSKGSVHSLLATLEAVEVVRRDHLTSRYRLGWKLFELGSVVLRDQDVQEAAGGHLEHMASETGETALLAILVDSEALYLEHAHGTQSVQLVAARGRRAPLHATASGKVLLAHADDAVLGSLTAHPLERYTSRTICDVPALRTALSDVREHGYAVVHEEREPGLSAISVPIRNYTKAVVAALSLAGPSVRFTPAALDAMLVVLSERSDEISKELGYRP